MCIVALPRLGVSPASYRHHDWPRVQEWMGNKGETRRETGLDIDGRHVLSSATNPPGCARLIYCCCKVSVQARSKVPIESCVKATYVSPRYSTGRRNISVLYLDTTLPLTLFPLYCFNITQTFNRNEKLQFFVVINC